MISKNAFSEIRILIQHLKQKGIEKIHFADVDAITVYEFINGRGCEVGGDDGFGVIILPEKLPLHDLLK